MSKKSWLGRHWFPLIVIILCLVAFLYYDYWVWFGRVKRVNVEEDWACVLEETYTTEMVDWEKTKTIECNQQRCVIELWTYNITNTTCLIEGSDCEEKRIPYKTVEIFCCTEIDEEGVWTTCKGVEYIDEVWKEKCTDEGWIKKETLYNYKTECSRYRDAQTKEECNRFLEKTDTKKYDTECLFETFEKLDTNVAYATAFTHCLIESEQMKQKLVCGSKTYDIEELI